MTVCENKKVSSDHLHVSSKFMFLWSLAMDDNFQWKFFQQIKLWGMQGKNNRNLQQCRIHLVSF